MKLLEQIDGYIDGVPEYDDELFEKMADFIISLDDEPLSDDAFEEMEDILEELDYEDDGEEIDELRMSKRTPSSKRMQAKRYARTHRTKIKRRKQKLSRSAEGKRRKRLTTRLAKAGRTATGRRKIRYHS